MDKFADYIWYLLPGVLKKNKSINQLYIFCKVTGKIFDDIKAMLFRLRKETMLETCSDCILEVFGQDRDMYQMKGETYIQYRQRLKMKAQIAEMAGLLQGILYALQAVGYGNCTIYPLYKDDPDRWAEINIDFWVSSVDDQNEIDFACIVNEVMHTKKASTLPHYIFHYPILIQNREDIENCRTVHRFTSNFFENVLYLDGSWVLDGTKILGGSFDNLDARNIIRTEAELTEKISSKMTIKNDLWYLDGEVLLDGSRKLDAYIKEEML